MRLVLVTLLCALNFVTARQSFADWPAWRGPAANTIAPDGDYPVEFGPGKNELWSIDLPGAGTSTPVVWGDAIFLTAVDDEHNLVCCYGLDGKPRWSKELGAKTPAKHRSATGGNPSPVADAEHVVVYFKSGELTCFSHSGDIVWDLNLQEEFGDDTLWWDLGTSPVMTSAGVCVAVMQAGDSYLVTFDLDTGRVLWKQPRVYDRPRESDQAYTTPGVVMLDGKETIVTWGADHLTGHDAKTGKLLWEHDGFNPEDKPMWRVIASATIEAGIAYVPYGRTEHLAAVRLGEDSETLWDITGVGTDVPCPVAQDGKLYVLGDKGEITCLNAETGEEIWRERLPRGRGQFYSSPLLADGKLYCVRENGELYVVGISDGFKLLAENDLRDDTVATPVPVEAGLLMRTRTKLSLFGNDS